MIDPRTSLRSSQDSISGDLTVAIGVAGGAASIAAAAAALRVAATQGYWTAGYYRLVLASLWYFFDRWVPAAVGVAVAVVLIRWAAGRFGFTVRLSPGSRMVRAGLILILLLGGGRALGALDVWLNADGPNILLISVDTLRADRLGAYGYDRPTSPIIDSRLAEEGVTFESCYSQSPKTTPSHMTMLTSLYPCVHGIPLWKGTTPGPVLNPAVHTLAEVLKNAGYTTAAFTGRGQMHRSRGFNQGFDVYKHGYQLDRAREWLSRQGHRKFFLFFHTYAVHDPYVPPDRLVVLFDEEGYQGPVLAAVKRLRQDVGGWRPAHRIFWNSVDSKDPRDIRFVQRLYDAVIRHMDEGTIGPLLDHLDALELAEETLVVFTSDHGEAFAEHGVFLHDDLYGETLRVPLILRFPGRLPPEQRIQQRVRLIDVMPTIFDLLGISPPPVQQGRSLVPLLDGVVAEEEPWDAASEYSDAETGRVFESLRHRHVTYIVDGSSEQLFDHVVDPREQNNLLAAPPLELKTIRGELARWREECRGLRVEFGPGDEKVEPSDETVRQLRALGYVE